MAGLTLKELAAQDPQVLEQYYQRMLSEAGGNPNGAMTQSDINRGVAQGGLGNKSAWSQGMSPDDLALLDRYAWGAQIAQQPTGSAVALIPAAAYEGVKAVATPVMEAAGRVLPMGEEMKRDETTSNPSWENVKALWEGYKRGSVTRR